MTHPNSAAAHAKLPSDRHAAVLECYRQHGPLTDRQVAKILGGENADCNLARPRITEAIASDELEECGSVKEQGRKVRICRIKERRAFCNHTFAGHLKKVPSTKRKGYVAVVCVNPAHEKPVFYGYEVAGSDQ